MCLTEEIGGSIKGLKVAKGDDRIKQYNLIASKINRFLRDTKTNYFDKGLILSFFSKGFFNERTQQRHIKQILSVMQDKGFIVVTLREKTYKRRRINELKTQDFESYNTLMGKNGFKVVDYFVYYKSKEGIPKRRKVASTNINALPSVDFDISVLRQTLPRRKQAVYSFSNKSISIEETKKPVKCFKVAY